MPITPHPLPHRGGHPSGRCAGVIVALLLALGSTPPALASAQLFGEQGCYNCHGNPPRGDAPSVQRLADKLARFKGDAAGEQKFVEKFLGGELLRHIDSHERVTAETAGKLVHWLVEGAK